MLVYKIPYRRAPRLAFRPSASRLYTRYPIVARELGLAAVQPLGRVRRASKGILHTSVARAKVSCIQSSCMIHIFSN